MALLLHIDTATTNCSVSISENERLLDTIELNEGYTHAENLHTFMKQLLQRNSLEPKQLNAISVSSGPGSYTGLRIGVSAAKGLCFALKIPLIGISTLQIMSAAIPKEPLAKDTLLVPMIDARRMEVYCTIFDLELNPMSATEAMIIDEETVKMFQKDQPMLFFGDGMPKCKELLNSIANARFADGIIPSSRFMAALASSKYHANDFENTAYFEPNYLKEFYTTKK